MRILRTYNGDGALLAGGKEYPGPYEIEAYERGDVRGASGSIDGIQSDDVFKLLTSGDVKLKMADGSVVSVTLSGGSVAGPQHFTLNDPPPGL